MIGKPLDARENHHRDRNRKQHDRHAIDRPVEEGDVEAKRLFDKTRGDRVGRAADERAKPAERGGEGDAHRSEEHTSELQSLMRISYAVFCLKKTKNTLNTHVIRTNTNKYSYIVYN